MCDVRARFGLGGVNARVRAVRKRGVDISAHKSSNYELMRTYVDFVPQSAGLTCKPVCEHAAPRVPSDVDLLRAGLQHLDEPVFTILTSTLCSMGARPDGPLSEAPAAALPLLAGPPFPCAAAEAGIST